MTTRSCVQCSHPLSETARFCAECGALVQGEAAAPLTGNTVLFVLPPAMASAGTSAAPAQPATAGPAPPEPAVAAAAPAEIGPTAAAAPIEAGPAAEAPPPAASADASAAASPSAAPAPAQSTLVLAGAAPKNPAPAAASSRPATRTLLLTPAPPVAAAPAAAAAAFAVASKRTMVGLPLLPAGPQQPPVETAPATLARNRTILGVALPGIAPLHAGDAATHPAPSPEPPELANSTLDGSPPPSALAETLPIPAFFVPPPAPLVDEPAPSRPRRARRGGASLAVAAVLAGGVALVGGAVMAIVWRSAPPITAQPRIAPDGKDVLHLVCEASSCQDGTLVSFGGAHAAFAAGEADLPLATPLRVGDNAITLTVDRPGMGGAESVKLVVPVAYRVRADVTTMQGPHPCITIRVEAPPQTEVRVDDKPVPLDSSGAGTFALDETAAAEGPADESRIVAIDVPYAIVPKGRPPEGGMVSARIAVAPLRVDAPGTSTVIDEDKLLIAGRAARGATVRVDGAAVPVAPDGAFETTIDVDALGERTVDVRAETGALAPRTVHIPVSRVANLADAAKEFEEREPVGYDAAMRDIAESKTGEAIVVDGDVLETRGSAHRTLALVDDRRGCAKGPCLARVIIGRDLSITPGENLRAYGRVARAYRIPTAQTVPEIEAEFVLRAKR